MLFVVVKNLKCVTLIYFYLGQNMNYCYSVMFLLFYCLIYLLWPVSFYCGVIPENHKIGILSRKIMRLAIILAIESGIFCCSRIVNNKFKKCFKKYKFLNIFFYFRYLCRKNIYFPLTFRLYFHTKCLNFFKSPFSYILL